jgi:glutamate-1-semialdehyde 2,1-aminomutase
MSERYQHSEQWLERALAVIPLGTQTFSKSLTQYPREASPYFVKRAEGSHLWDVDGNEYVDFVNGLLSVMLGYGDKDVTQAVQEQLLEGVLFTLPHTIEVEVAEKICEMVASADSVRYGKNGSDATSGAIRAARAHTGRDRVAVCGYHGWQDWYVGSTLRDLGVPQATKELTHAFVYNNLDSLNDLLRAHPDEFAAVILEPMGIAEPKDGFLEGVRELCTKHGTVLVFDEIITGFRFSRGGAQELFNVTPDLTTFGKGMANGYPLSVVTGRGDIMKQMEEVFFSFTAGGEALSLAAARATLNKIQREPVVETLRARGQAVQDGCLALIEKHGMAHILDTSGHPAWNFLIIKDAGKYTQWEIKSLWMQEIQARGILCLGTHNMSYAHSEADVARLLQVYDEVFPIMRDAVDNEAMAQHLHCKPIEPLFKVR